MNKLATIKCSCHKSFLLCWPRFPTASAVVLLCIGCRPSVHQLSSFCASAVVILCIGCRPTVHVAKYNFVNNALGGTSPNSCTQKPLNKLDLSEFTLELNARSVNYGANIV